MGGHLAALRDLWLGHRARSAAQAALQGLLRPPACSDPLAPAPAGPDWTDAYRLGFLASAITLLARHAGPGLGSEGLGYVQRSVFSALTGVPGDLVSQHLVAFSLEQDPAFLAGCADALVFAAARIADLEIPDLEIPDLEQADLAEPGAARQSELLWVHYLSRRHSGA